jgi:hypothetical protein
MGTTSLIPKRGSIGTIASYSTTANGDINGLVGADFTLRESLKEFPNGQPQGITRPLTSRGKKVVGFASTDGWVLSSGTVAGTNVNITQNYTGLDPTTGAVTGIVSKSGTSKMTKFEVLTSGNVMMQKTGLSVNTNGRFGVWVYIDNPSLLPVTLHLTAATSGGVGPNDYGFNSNALRSNEWNFLVVARKANPISNSDVEQHPFGVGESIWNFANSAFVTNPIINMSIYAENSAGVTFYFDEVLTGWTVKPQFCIGGDSSGSYTNSIVLPKFNQYGWKGYIAETFRISSGEVSDWTASGKTAALDAVYLAGWDIINHSVNHQNVTSSFPADASIMRYEVEASRAWLLSLGYVRGSEFYASPQSGTNALSRKVIADAGFKLQRHGVKDATQVTAFGVEQPAYIGSIDVGGNGWIYGATGGYAYNYPHIDNLRKWVDMVIKYGATGFPFFHGLKTLGDPGDGTGNSGDTIQMYKSTFDMFMDYIAEKEAAGLCRVTDGMTGFYYGVGR